MSENESEYTPEVVCREMQMTWDQNKSTEEWWTELHTYRRMKNLPYAVFLKGLDLFKRIKQQREAEAERENARFRRTKPPTRGGGKLNSMW